MQPRVARGTQALCWDALVFDVYMATNLLMRLHILIITAKFSKF